MGVFAPEAVRTTTTTKAPIVVTPKLKPVSERALVRWQANRTHRTMGPEDRRRLPTTSGANEGMDCGCCCRSVYRGYLAKRAELACVTHLLWARAAAAAKRRISISASLASRNSTGCEACPAPRLSSPVKFERLTRRQWRIHIGELLARGGGGGGGAERGPAAHLRATSGAATHPIACRCRRLLCCSSHSGSRSALETARSSSRGGASMGLASTLQRQSHPPGRSIKRPPQAAIERKRSRAGTQARATLVGSQMALADDCLRRRSRPELASGGGAFEPLARSLGPELGPRQRPGPGARPLGLRRLSRRRGSARICISALGFRLSTAAAPAKRQRATYRRVSSVPRRGRDPRKATALACTHSRQRSALTRAQAHALVAFASAEPPSEPHNCGRAIVSPPAELPPCSRPPPASALRAPSWRSLERAPPRVESV
jgi:hypothetical protein